jgi:hypothetical protein
MTWLLLIYTVPAQPSAKRAAVWRDVKRAGAVYMRDGVCALPQRPDTTRTFEDIAAKVIEFGGQATVARGVQLDDVKSERIREDSRAARVQEYEDVRHEIEALLLHIKQEGVHRHFGFPELEQLDSDLAKLRRWLGQIAARDFENLEAQCEADELLKTCETDIASFLDRAYEREEASR